MDTTLMSSMPAPVETAQLSPVNGNEALPAIEHSTRPPKTSRDVRVLMSAVRENVFDVSARRRDCLQWIKDHEERRSAGSVRFADSGPPELEVAGRTLQDVRHLVRQIGALPPNPGSFRANLGAALIRLLQVGFHWYNYGVRQFAEAASRGLDESLHVSYRLRQRIDELDRAVTDLNATVEQLRQAGSDRPVLGLDAELVRVQSVLQMYRQAGLSQKPSESVDSDRAIPPGIGARQSLLSAIKNHLRSKPLPTGDWIAIRPPVEAGLLFDQSLLPTVKVCLASPLEQVNWLPFGGEIQFCPPMELIDSTPDHSVALCVAGDIFGSTDAMTWPNWIEGFRRVLASGGALVLFLERTAGSTGDSRTRRIASLLPEFGFELPFVIFPPAVADETSALSSNNQYSIWESVLMLRVP